MLGKFFGILSLFTAALFIWVILGSLKQDNCINSNNIRNIIIFEGETQKIIPHCNDLKLSSENLDYNDIKIIKAVNKYSAHWIFSTIQSPKKFPIRKLSFKSNSKNEKNILTQMIQYNFFRSKNINWLESSYLYFFEKLILSKPVSDIAFASVLQASTACEGCQKNIIENISNASQEFQFELAKYTSAYLYKKHQESNLKQKILFNYFIKRGNLSSSLKTINQLYQKGSFKKLNLASQIKTITMWMSFYSQNDGQQVNLNLSHNILPTAYEFETALPIVWGDFTTIKNKKVQLRINSNSYDLVYGWILNLNEKVSRNKQIYLFQCGYPKLKKAMKYLFKTPKLVYVKICNTKQMVQLLKSLPEQPETLDLAKLNFKYVEYNLSSLKLIEKKLQKDFSLRPQNLSSVLFWQDLIQDPVTKIVHPKAAIDGVVSFRN